MDVTIVGSSGHTVVRARGLLSPRTAPDLREALLKAAAEQPRGLVCDLGSVRATREGLTVLHVVADQVADWPSTPLALVATAPPLLEQLDRLCLSLRLPVAPDLGRAVVALRRAPRLLVASTHLAPTVDAPAVARAFVGGALLRWRVDGADEAARWVVSELVANAVVHTGTDLTVRASLSGRRIGISVADHGDGALRPGAGGGLGLRVVERLSRSWGVLPRLGGGTAVWAVLDVEGPVPAVLPQQAAQPW